MSDEESFNDYMLTLAETASLVSTPRSSLRNQSRRQSRIRLCKIDGLAGWIQVEKESDSTHYGVIAMDRTGDSNTDDLYFTNDLIYEVHLRT
jgi:hypothetical protein